MCIILIGALLRAALVYNLSIYQMRLMKLGIVHLKGAEN